MPSSAGNNGFLNVGKVKYDLQTIISGGIKNGCIKSFIKSNPTSVASALASVVKEEGSAELQAIGAGAVNQTMKAIAIARGYLAISGKDVVCIPAFSDVYINGMERTALRFIVESIDLGYAI